MAQNLISFDRTDITFDSIMYTWDATTDVVFDHVKTLTVDVLATRYVMKNVFATKYIMRNVNITRDTTKNIII